MAQSRASYRAFGRGRAGTSLAVASAERTAGRAIEHPDEEARRIVGTVLRGDREAFGRLVERESVGLVRLCHRVLGDVGEAEDVAQEAFVTAYRSLGTWRGDGTFGAWLARIAVRLAVRHARRRRRITWIEPIDPVTGAGFDPPAEEHLEPPAQALRGEREERVRRAVAELREPYREVVALRFFAGLSLAEIAGETGRPLGTVKTHLHRGLARLRDAVGEVA